MKWTKGLDEGPFEDRSIDYTYGSIGNHASPVDEIKLLKSFNIDPFIVDMKRTRPYDQLDEKHQTVFNPNYTRIIYFSDRPYNCKPNCVQDCRSALKPFTIYENDHLFLMDPSLELNEPCAERKVYKGEWHGQSAAFKCIFHDVDKDNNFEEIDAEFFEQMRISKRPGAQNILKPYAYLKGQIRELTDGVLMSQRNMTILIYPKCDTDLRKLIKDPSNDWIFKKKNFWYLIDCCLNGMKVIAERELCHNDIKPSNILLNIKSEEDFEVFIADFGLCKAVGGGTPGFASPECYSRDGFQTWKSDIYSFGKTLEYILLGNLMNEPDRNNNLLWNQAFGMKNVLHEKILKEFPILKCIKEMTNRNFQRRPSFQSIKSQLKSAINRGRFDVKRLRDKLKVQKSRDDNSMAFEKCDLDGTLGSLMTGLTLNTSLPVSKIVHDQGDTQLCWAYATATMIRSSLKIFLRNVESFIFNGHHKINEMNKPSKYKELVDFLELVRALLYDETSETFHRIVRKQLRMFVCPRSIYRKDVSQAAFLDNLIYKVSNIYFIDSCNFDFKLATPTILGSAGIYQIPFIRELLDPFWTKFDLPILIEFKEVFHPSVCEDSKIHDNYLREVLISF